MTQVAIPPWTATGVLPPINVADPTRSERSPYFVSLSEFVLRFGTSVRRAHILQGFLRYRARLHAADLVQGFQWLDGSFLEDIEHIESREPNELDVVTFYRLPAGVSEAEVLKRVPEAFPTTRGGRMTCKGNFFVDPQFINLDSPPERLVRFSAFWYSMWSHRRDLRWKGFLHVDLAPAEDEVASSHVKTVLATGGTS
jgi:hypothetical protein